MVSKIKLVLLLIAFSIFINIFTFFVYFFTIGSILKITGQSAFASVGLIILGPSTIVNILSPENLSYNFSIGETNYTLSLNVSASFNPNIWWYRLEDLKHGTVNISKQYFEPNSTFRAVRWSNNLTVYANNSEGEYAFSSVVFYVNVPNSAPVLGEIPNEIYFCEGNSSSFVFNASDKDEDSLYFEMNPLDPFFIHKKNETFMPGLTLSYGEIYSGVLKKKDVGKYTYFVSVRDGGEPEYSDGAYLNITVIEVNNPPVVSFIGAKTLWTYGDNSSLYLQVNVSDIESGNLSSNFTYNLTFLNGNKFFDINKTGFINVTANSSLVGVYNISLCVTDRALGNVSENISLCGQNGSNQTSCQNFSITITDGNRAPQIVSYFPVILNFSVSGNDLIYFNMTSYDADGTLADIYWFVDEVQKIYQSGSLFGNFFYYFGCGVSGWHFVKAKVSDGLMENYIQWNLFVEEVPCPAVTVGGGGGAGGGAGITSIEQVCMPKWACNFWEDCVNLEEGFNNQKISSLEYVFVKSSCNSNKLTNEFCGFQRRTCRDLNSCNSSLGKPEEIKQCYFTVNPSCSDGIKNCHDGSCEFLVDCGGPCEPCPSCSDGIKNQGEEAVDCGGPCPKKCASEIEKKRFPFYLILILVIALIILGIRAYKFFVLKKINKRFYLL